MDSELNITSGIDPDKCITYQELQDIISGIQTGNIVDQFAKLFSSFSGEIRDNRLVAINSTNTKYQLLSSVYPYGAIQVSAKSTVVADIENRTIQIPTNGFVIYKSDSYIQYQVVVSHYDLSGATWALVIL